MLGFGPDVTGVGVLALVVAASFVLDGLLALIGIWRMRAPAVGTVTALEWNGGCHDPVVEFVADDGTRGRFRAPRDGYLELGQRIPVAYSPRAPHRARIATPMGSYRRPAMALVLAPIFLSIAWTNGVSADDRLKGYLALHQASYSLKRCTEHPCSATTIQRRQRAVVRASVAAEPVVSSPVAARIADLRSSLARARPGQTDLPVAQIEALYYAIQRDMEQVVIGEQPSDSPR